MEFFSSLLNDAKERASAVLAGREFQAGMVRGKNEYLKVFVLADMCWNFNEWFDLVRA